MMVRFCSQLASHMSSPVDLIAQVELILLEDYGLSQGEEW